MRINFRRSAYTKDSRRWIIQDLIKQLCDDYDLDTITTTDWIYKTKNGPATFIQYLTEQGYQVRSYTWPTEKDPISYGLEFDDTDPLIIALKLKHNEN